MEASSIGENHLRAITEAVQAMNLPPDVAAVVDEIVVQAPIFLPEFQHVCLSLAGPKGSLETLAATTDPAARFDALQDQSGEGPCVDSVIKDETVIVADARHEQRWPTYIPQAVELGLRSQLGVRLPGQDGRLLGLNLYSTSHDEFDPGSVGVAEHFAVHAGLALGHVRREDQLQTAIGTRTLIGTAIGVLIHKYGLNQEIAFAYLVREASRQNRKLRLVAKDIVEEAESASGFGCG